MTPEEQQKTPDLLYLFAFVDGDRGAMAKYLHMVGENGAGYSLASDTAAFFGQVKNARELAEKSATAYATSDQQESGAITLAVAAQWEAAFGYPGRGRELAARALNRAPTSLGAKVEVAIAFALAGDVSRAEAIALDLNQRFPLDEQVQSIWLPAIRGQIALVRNDPSKALTALAAPAQIEYGNIQFLLVANCLYTAYVRENAYLAPGDGSAAAAEFQRIVDHSGVVDNCWTGALARLGVARANALQAKDSAGADADLARARALAACKDLLTLWKDADPEIPVYQQAKAEYAKLK